VSDTTIALLVAVSIMGLWFCSWGFVRIVLRTRRLRLLRESRHWTHGVAEVETVRECWTSIRVTYLYQTYDGSYRGTHNVALPIIPFTGLGGVSVLRRAVNLAMARFNQGKQIPIRYNPLKPYESVVVLEHSELE
jgi:hypothetical protein